MDQGISTEWTDTESDTITRDGIELPARVITNNSDFLTPAAGKENGDADHTDTTKQSVQAVLIQTLLLYLSTIQ